MARAAGARSNFLPRLREALAQAQAQGVFSAGVLEVWQEDRLRHRSAHGMTSWWPGARRVNAHTCFDLASLTKPLALATVMVEQVAAGRLRLEQRVGEFLPRAACAAVTLAQLLEHAAGLPAWRPYFYEVAARHRPGSPAARHALRSMLAAERPRHEPGSHSEYSDIGFMLLEWIVERATGSTLDVLLARRLRRLPGRPRLFFQRGNRPRPGVGYAATELCPWRRRVLCGQVHDDNAYVMGGVGGHAGLFGTAPAVAALARAWLQAYRGQGAWRAGRRLVPRFWQKSAVPGSSRTLGFDTPSGKDSQAGRLLGPGTVGHLGFTGTSLWIDPARRLIIVLLTNRVHPRRDNQAIRRLRPLLHDLVVEECDR